MLSKKLFLNRLRYNHLSIQMKYLLIWPYIPYVHTHKPLFPLLRVYTYIQLWLFICYASHMQFLFCHFILFTKRKEEILMDLRSHALTLLLVHTELILGLCCLGLRYEHTFFETYTYSLCMSVSCYA